MTGLWLISYIALWLLFFLVAIALVSVLRNLGVIYESLETMVPRSRRASTKFTAGDIVPDLTLSTLAGEEVNISNFRGRKMAFLIVSPNCSPCRDLLRDIAENGESLDPLDPSVHHKAIVSIGNKPETIELVQDVNLSQDPILLDTENLVAREWGIMSTPMIVIVDEQLKVARQIIGGACGPRIEEVRWGGL
jgi:thioredoxin-related protein